MKALLFTLLLVAFMCKDAVTSLKCYMCGEVMCDWKMHCPAHGEFCVTMMRPDGIRKNKGCARVCPGEEHGKLLECCRTDFCNTG